MYKTLEVSCKGEVLKVKLNRPEVHNAMNDTMMIELIEIFNDCKKQEDIRAIVLTGEGKSFCAGADLNWMKSMVNYTMEENIKDSETLLNLFEAIYTCPKVVIGRINGHAFGGGIGLIAVCDITVAVEGKKFAFSEVKLGIIPSVISTYVVRRIGIANMRRLFITGERFDSTYAHKIGLIDYVVPQDLLDSKVTEELEKIMTSGPRAIAEIKGLTDRYIQVPIDEYKAYTVEKIAELRVGEEGQEGINAFLQKRKPRWCE